MYENKYKIEKDIIYPREVFEIVGIMYDVWNEKEIKNSKNN